MGKTSLASRLSTTLGAPFFELALYLRSGAGRAMPVNNEAEIADLPSWVIVGAADWLVSNATMVIWLNYSLPVALRRGFGRAREQGEPLFSQFFPPGKSWLLWILRSWFRNRKKIPAMVAADAFRNTTLIELKLPDLAEDLMRRIEREVTLRDQAPTTGSAVRADAVSARDAGRPRSN